MWHQLGVRSHRDEGRGERGRVEREEVQGWVWSCLRARRGGHWIVGSRREERRTGIDPELTHRGHSWSERETKIIVHDQ